VEHHFQRCTTETNVERQLVVLDGTGTHPTRRIRRIEEAKSAGYWTILLHVHVTLETAIRRQSFRARSAPTAVLEQYHARLQGAMAKQKNFVDEYVIFDNDIDEIAEKAVAGWGAFRCWWCERLPARGFGNQITKQCDVCL
jgi:hypothetical protein